MKRFNATISVEYINEKNCYSFSDLVRKVARFVGAVRRSHLRIVLTFVIPIFAFYLKIQP